MKMKRHAIYLLFAMLRVPLLACGVTFALPGARQSQIVEVYADQAWNDTGIAIRSGDLLTIDYLAGKWSPWPGDSYDAIGSGGDPVCRCNVLNGVSHAALLGRIGDQEIFFVGDQFHHRVGEEGTLYLGINDVDLGDNSGSLQVEVTIHR